MNVNWVSGVQQTLRPINLGCEPTGKGCYLLHSLSPFIIVTQQESQYSSDHPTKGGKLVDLGTALTMSNLYLRLYATVDAMVNTTAHEIWSQGSLTPQSGMLPLDHCNLQLY